MPKLVDILPQGSEPILTVVLTLLVAFVLSRGSSRLIGRLVTLGHLQPKMAERLQSFRRWTVIAIAGLVVLQVTGLFHNAWALLSTVLATVAIGFFAAWSILSNATGALLILTFRPFRLGDTVELVEPSNGSVLRGVVSDINLMYTTLDERDAATGERAVLQVPNNLFFQKLVRTLPASRLTQPTDPFFRDSREPPAPTRGD